MHPYQRGRTSIKRLMLWSVQNIGTERLVGVVVARLVGLLFFVSGLNYHGYCVATSEPLTIRKDPLHCVFQCL